MPPRKPPKRRPPPASSPPPPPNDERFEQIFNALPPLGSAEYIRHIQSTPATELPAQVLVRAYRQLPPGEAADATLGRLLGYNDRDGYLTPLFTAAKRRISRHDAYGVDDLVQDAIGEIVVTLGGPRGAGAETAWVSYLTHRMEDAYRKQVGRRGERRPKRAEPVVDPETGEEHDPIDVAGITRGPVQGNVEPSDMEWLESFIRRTFARVPNEKMRQVAFLLFEEDATPVSSNDPTDTNTLEHRFQVSRFTIYRWQRAARALLLAALQSQNERPGFDTGFLGRGP